MRIRFTFNSSAQRGETWQNVAVAVSLWRTVSVTHKYHRTASHSVEGGAALGISVSLVMTDGSGVPVSNDDTTEYYYP